MRHHERALLQNSGHAKVAQPRANLAPPPALLHLLSPPTSSFQGPGKNTNPISYGRGVTMSPPHVTGSAVPSP